MKKLFILIWLLVCAVSFANNDKYRLILVTDPATSITIGWNQTSGSNPVVWYGTTDHGNSNHTLYSNSKTVDRTVTSRGMDNNFARLTGLTPATAYYFVINDSQGNSERFWFKTAPDDTRRLSFIAGGDSRNNRGPRQDANRIVAKLKPTAVLFGGDMTNGDSSSEWQDWLDDWQLTTSTVDDANNTSNRMIPIVPAVGNHEGSDVIWELFDTPDSDSYYAITFGDNMYREYTLNTNISVSGNQLTWLENDLSNNLDTRWRSAQYHKPMRPHESGKSEGEAHYQAWAELFYDSGVRLVTDSDSHMVKTTWPVKPSSEPGSDEGFIREDIYGTVYAGEGCWGAPLRANDDDKAWTRNSASFNQFKLIYVGLNEIELRTVEVDNESSVPVLDDDDPFGLVDSNTYLWNPSEGLVVTINYIDLPASPKITFEDGEFNDYGNGTNLNLAVDVLETGGGITKVDFYIDGVFDSSDTTAPYAFTNTYAAGSYSVEAIATNTSLRTHETTININVGTFSTNEIIFIADGNDDVEEDESNGTVYFDSSDLEFFDDGGWQKIGLRFQNLGIPNGATIDNADIRFKSDASDSQSDMNMRVYIEDAGNAAPFDSNSTLNVSGRAVVGSSVVWGVPSWSDGERGNDTTTPDLKDLLQAVVDRCDWTPGNSVVFVFERTGVNANNASVERKADTFEENGAQDAAQIRFGFTYNAGVSNPSLTKFVSNAWTNGTPSSNSTVILLDDYDTAVHGNIEACYLEIKAGKELVIGAGNFVRVNGDTSIDGTLTIEHEGSFLQIESDAKVENNGTIQVEITTPVLQTRDFMVMGSPMTNEKRSDVYDSAFLVLDHHPNNFIPNTNPLIPQGATNFSDDNGDFWNSYSGVINPGEGYIVRPQSGYGDPANVNFYFTHDRGTLNNGDISRPVIYNGTNSPAGTPNILANPYPSAIDADDLLTQMVNNGNFANELYFWEHLSPPSVIIPGEHLKFDMDDVSIYNLSGGTQANNDPIGDTEPNGVISTGQGFAIKATANATVTFTNAMRLTTGNSTLRAPEEDVDRLWLRVESDAYEVASNTMLAFNPSAGPGYDPGYDSDRLACSVSLYSHFEAGDKEMSIQTRGAFNQTMKIPFGFDTQIDEETAYTISMNKFDGVNLENRDVFLYDNVVALAVNLSEQDYQFMSARSINNRRFIIFFDQDSVLNVTNNSIDEIALYPNPAKDVINIASRSSALTGLKIYDISGKLVVNLTLDNSLEHRLDISQLRSALYLVEVTTVDGVVVKRFIKR
jgi:hypothetical protein